jgi:hypothetical protein
MRAFLFLILAFGTPSTFAQQQAPPSPKNVTLSGSVNAPETVVLSGTATNARIADPNERVIFSGYVMRVADFVAVISSSTAEVQHLRTPEKHNHEKDQPTAPSRPPN